MDQYILIPLDAYGSQTMDEAEEQVLPFSPQIGFRPPLIFINEGFLEGARSLYETRGCFLR